MKYDSGYKMLSSPLAIFCIPTHFVAVPFPYFISQILCGGHYLALHQRNTEDLSSIPGTGRNKVAWMLTSNGGFLSLGPTPSGMLITNLNDVDRWFFIPIVKEGGLRN